MSNITAAGRRRRRELDSGDNRHPEQPSPQHIFTHLHAILNRRQTLLANDMCLIVFRCICIVSDMLFRCLLACVMFAMATGQNSNSLPVVVIQIAGGKLTVSAGNSSSAPISITPATLTPTPFPTPHVHPTPKPTPFPTPHAHPTPKPNLIDDLEKDVEDTSTRNLLWVVIAIMSIFILWSCVSSCNNTSGSSRKRPTYYSTGMHYLTDGGGGC